jgi:hypothetical protein
VDESHLKKGCCFTLVSNFSKKNWDFPNERDTNIFPKNLFEYSCLFAHMRALAALAVAAACVILAMAVVLDRTPAMTSLSLESKDLDAPNNLDRAIMVSPL